jgi:hypothetical protein
MNMLEQESIQSRSFRNVSQNGKITGFQVAIRSLYYRGVWLSQLRPATIIVNGEKFGNDQITWTISGKTYEQSDLAKFSDVHWSLLEPAILTVKKSGGLKMGEYEVEVSYTNSSSYMPPQLDTVLVGPTKRKMVLVR